MSRINIQYIWVEYYKCLENAEFNFSTKYDIHYDKDTNTLSCEKKDGYIDKFFGDNIDLTAIVGGNGAGKTTVLEMLRDDDIEDRTKFIFVFERNGKALIYYYTFEKQPTLKGFKESFGCKPQFVLQSEDPRITYPNPCHRQEIKTVLSSETISNPHYNMCYHTNFDSINLSSTNLISKSESLFSYFHKDIKKQIVFNSEYNSKNKVLPFQLRNIVEIHINHDIRNWIYAFLSELTKERERLETKKIDLFLESQDSLHDSYFDIFKSSLCVALFGSFFQNIIKDIFYLLKEQNLKYTYTDIYNMVCSSVEIARCSNAKKWNRMIAFLEHAEKKCISTLTYAPYIQHSLSRVITKYKRYMEYIESIKDEISLEHISDRHFTISTDQIGDFFNEYRKAAENYDFLNFSWGYSSGEMAMFNLFSRFYSIKDEISKADNALILIDEADMLYHPEWQQKYIKSLVEFLPTIYEGTHLQIILATHSPIMLSDVPKQNVIYLKQGENGNTIVDPNSRHKESFGQNIFRLFNDAFFLEEGAMGDFAREKLEKLVERIHDLPNITNNYNAVYKAIQHEIDIIGDNFIREKLQAELEKHLNIPNRVQLLEDQMAKIQEQIKNLKKQEKNGND